MNRAELHRLVAGLIPCDATTASIVARRVVDAVLPQITRESQLDWYGDGTQLLAGPPHQLFGLSSPDLVDPISGRRYPIAVALNKFGPLTVVWAA